MISIVVMPILLAVQAASIRDRPRSWRMLQISWAIYAFLWFCTLYYLRYRWQ